jgi:putative two-component system response regulator
MISDPFLRRLKILIVDDETVNVALLEDMLRTSGYHRIQSVIDSRTALDVCAAFDPDLVLLDLMMPHVDGFTILESLRAGEGIETFLPVVVLTADMNGETKRRALTAGATDFLVKPFDQTEVLLRIRNLLEIRRVHLLLDNQRVALEDAVRERTTGLRTAISELQRSQRVIGTLLAEKLDLPSGDPLPKAGSAARENRH